MANGDSSFVFASDVESGTAGTLLENHPMANGGPWVASQGSMILTAGATSRGTTTQSIYYTTAASVGANSYVTERFKFLSGTDQRYLILRGNIGGNIGSNIGYMGGYDGSQNKWQIRVNTGILVASAAAPLAPGATPLVLFTANGPTLTLTVDGTVVLTTTDATYKTAGHAGLFTYGVAADDNGGLQGSTFSASCFPAPTFTAKVGDRGGLVFARCLDSAGNEANLTALGSFAGASITVDGVTTALTQPLWDARYPDVVFPVATPIASSSVVTLNLPAGLAVTNAGNTAAVAALAVTNPGTILPARSTTPKTLALGYNMSGDYYGGYGRVYSNFFKGSPFYDGGNFLSFDANHWPTSLAGYSCQMPIATPPTDYGGAGKGIPNAPNGVYRLIYDSSQNTIAVDANGNSATTITILSTVLTGGANNEIRFRATSTHFAPEIWIRINTDQSKAIAGTPVTYPCDVKNIRIYPPDTVADPTGNTPTLSPPKYYPWAKAQFGGGAWWRNMDSVPIIGSNARSRADLVSTSRSEFISPTRTASAVITSVVPYTGTDNYIGTLQVTRVLMTSQNPHGFQTGDLIGMPPGFGTIQTTGGPIDLTNASIIKVLSPTTFVFGAYAATAVSAMTGTFTPASNNNVVSMYVQASGMAWDDCAEYSNYLGANLHGNIPRMMALSEVQAIGAAHASVMPRGRKSLVEYSNECWNDYSPEKSYMNAMARTVLGTPGPNDYAIYQVYQSILVHRAYVAGWTGAGGSASEVVRYIGSSPGGSADILALCKGPVTSDYTAPDGTAYHYTVDLAAGTTVVKTTPSGGAATTATTTFPGLGAFSIDMVGPGVYLENNPFPASGLAATQANFTVGQCIDLARYNVERKAIYNWVVQHHIDIQAAALPYPVGVHVYEINVQTETPNGQVQYTTDPRPIAIHRHPDKGPIFDCWFDQLNDGGVSSACLYYMIGGNGLAEWGIYEGINMVAGTGTEPGATNISDPGNLPTVRSVIGGRLNAYMAGGAQATPAFAITDGTASASVVVGTPTTITITETGTGGYTGTVNLTISGLPAGVSGVFSPTSLAGGSGSSTLTLTAAPGTATATSAATITAGDGTTTHTLALAVTVTAAAASATPPAVGAISAASAGGIDTITYPAAAAGTNPVSGYALYMGHTAGGESPTPVTSNTGATGGLFTYPSPYPGTSNYYTVRAYDNQSTPLFSAATNEVSTARPPDTAPLPVLITSPLAGSLGGGVYWVYAPAAGHYALELVDGLLIVKPVQVTGQVIELPASGMYRVVFSSQRGGNSVVSTSQLPTTT